MKIPLLLSAFVALVTADVSHLSGYQYQQPATQSSYDVPQGSVVPSVNFVQYSQQQQQPSNAYQFSTQYSHSSGIGALPSQFGNNIAATSQGTSNSAASFNFGSGQSSNGATSVINAYQGQTSGGTIDESFGVVTDAVGGSSAAASDVAKHLYFFSAPEEEDEVIQAKYELPSVPAKKTYKIIFIKAPSYRNQGTIVVPAPPQNDEKTLVYVLVKKPEGQPKVHFKEAAPTQPTKPEVFFIKYKTQKEAEAAVAEIQSKHGANGQVIANLPAGTQAAFQSPDGSIVPSSVDIGSLSGIGNGGGFSLDSLGANSATIDSRISSEQQVTADQSLVSQSPTPASFGLSSVSVDSFGVSSSSISTESPQQEEVTTVESASAEQDCCSGNVAGTGNDVQGFSEYGVPKNRRFARSRFNF